MVNPEPSSIRLSVLTPSLTYGSRTHRAKQEFKDTVLVVGLAALATRYETGSCQL